MSLEVLFTGHSSDKPWTFNAEGIELVLFVVAWMTVSFHD